MKKTVLALVTLGAIFIGGCTKVEPAVLLEEAYFKIGEKIISKEELNEKYIKRLLKGYSCEKGEDLS